MSTEDRFLAKLRTLTEIQHRLAAMDPDALDDMQAFFRSLTADELAALRAELERHQDPG